ncbi:MAG: polysaccharide biosynthesis protein [Deltaproteobacteria bacterium]|nr:polysaccharide biosynthesis protein [Deltaproteobacteria bacterium]
MKRIFYKNFFIILLSDIILISFSWYFAYLLRFNFVIPEYSYYTIKYILPLIIAIKILSFYFFDLYQGMWRYTSLIDVVNILKACTVASVTILIMMLFVHGISGFPRSIFIIDWVLTLFLISGSRIGVRLFVSFSAGDKSARLLWKNFFKILRTHHHQGKKLLIIGAGDCGEKICREIHDNPHLGYQVMGFVDDDPSKANLKIHGIPVMGKMDEVQVLVKKTDAEELLIAMPTVSSRNMRKIVARCEKTGIPFKTVPSMTELINGRVTVKAIRDVAYEDLIGRESVKLDEERIGAYIRNKRVLITGAGGSIGSELCRQVCRFSPQSIILYERAESPLYEIELELRDICGDVQIIPRLADILNPLQLEKVFYEERPQVVFHAAAYKHVPMLELQPWEAMSNNLLGTRNLVEVSRQYHVERFVFVSSDKAVRPANMMGASKRLAEIYVQSQNGNGHRVSTRFMTVRFGNVVGSVGSVIPLFKKQIEKGGPITVTHPKMTRYFMTIPEACQLILQAGSMGQGSEIFILDMGVPIRIADMARDLIRLSGFEPDADIKIEYTGLRPGEKLQEELITDDEGIVQTSHEKIMVFKAPYREVDAINGKLDHFLSLIVNQDGEAIKDFIKVVLPEYKPHRKVAVGE